MHACLHVCHLYVHIKSIKTTQRQIVCIKFPGYVCVTMMKVGHSSAVCGDRSLQIAGV